MTDFFQRVLEIWMQQWYHWRTTSTQSQLCIPQKGSPGLTDTLSELRSRHNQKIKDNSQEGTGGLARGRGLHHLSLRLSVICYRPVIHTRQMFKCLNLSNRRAMAKERHGKEEGGRERALKHSSSSGFIAMSQREGGFQESAWRALCQTLPPQSQTLLCLKEDIKLENELFLASS